MILLRKYLQSQLCGISITLALRGLKQEDHEYEVSLVYKVKPFLVVNMLGPWEVTLLRGVALGLNIRVLINSVLQTVLMLADLL